MTPADPQHATVLQEPADIARLRQEYAAMEKAREILAGNLEVEAFEPEEIGAFLDLSGLYVRTKILRAGGVLCATIRPLQAFSASLLPADDGVLLLVDARHRTPTAAYATLFNDFPAALQALAETVFDNLTRFFGACPIDTEAQLQ